MDLDPRILTQKTLRDAFVTIASEARRQLETSATKLDDDLFNNEIRALREAVASINHKVKEFSQEIVANIQKLNNFVDECATLCELDSSLVQETLSSLSIIGPLQPIAIQLLSKLESEPHLTYTFLELKSRAGIAIPLDRRITSSLPSPSIEPPTIASESLSSEPEDAPSIQATRDGSPVQDIQDGTRPSIIVQSDAPQTPPFEPDDSSAQQIDGAPVRDRTPSADRPLVLSRETDDENENNNPPAVSEFKFTNAEYKGKVYVLRCPFPQCSNHVFEIHPFIYHRGVKHFVDNHPEVFGDEHPSRRFVFDNFALEVNGPPSLDIDTTFKNEVDFRKSTPCRRGATNKRRKQRKRRVQPTRRFSDADSTSLGASDKDTKFARRPPGMQMAPLSPSGDEHLLSIQTPQDHLGGEEVSEFGHNDGVVNDDDSEEDLDDLDSAFRPDEDRDAPSPQRGGVINGSKSSQPHASCKSVASSRSLPAPSRKRGRSPAGTDERPSFIVTVKTPRLNEQRTSHRESCSADRSCSVREGRHIAGPEPLPRRFARN